MPVDTQSKSILITGCSSGIGYHVAVRLKETGYQVIATARKQVDVERLQAEGFQALQLDLDSSDSIQQAFRQSMELTCGRLYGLFNNGAYGQTGAVEDLSREVLRAQLETNLLGWHELTNLVIPVMRKQGEGRIIYNSSVLGFVSMAYRGAYNCSKYALEGLVDTQRQELAGFIAEPRAAGGGKAEGRDILRLGDHAGAFQHLVIAPDRGFVQRRETCSQSHGLFRRDRGRFENPRHQVAGVPVDELYHAAFLRFGVGSG